MVKKDLPEPVRTKLLHNWANKYIKMCQHYPSVFFRFLSLLIASYRRLTNVSLVKALPSFREYWMMSWMLFPALMKGPQINTQMCLSVSSSTSVLPQFSTRLSCNLSIFPSSWPLSALRGHMASSHLCTVVASLNCVILKTKQFTFCLVSWAAHINC